jgi:hypothetical protein
MPRSVQSSWLSSFSFYRFAARPDDLTPGATWPFKTRLSRLAFKTGFQELAFKNAALAADSVSIDCSSGPIETAN